MNVKEMKKERKALKEEKSKLEAENDAIYNEYWDMEGKYGVVASDDWDYLQGMRGYHYEYAEGMREKEEAEREAFLNNSHYFANNQKIHEINKKIEKINNEICIIEHGMPEPAWSWFKAIKSAEAEIVEIQQRIVYYKAHYEEEMNKFNKELK